MGTPHLRAEANFTLGLKPFTPSGIVTLNGHTTDVMHVHAHGEHAASCSADGSVLVWSLRNPGAPLCRWTSWGAYCVQVPA